MSLQLDSSSKIFGYLLKNVTNTIVYCCSRCDAAFHISSELEDHINIHDSRKKNGKELNDLPDECFDAIFQFLPPDDLATMSETCTKYKVLAESYFNRKHQDESIGIADIKAVKFMFYGRKYLCRFRSLIRNLELCFHDSRAITDTFLTTKQNCAKRLHSLLLWSFNDECRISEVHFEAIAEQIETLEVLGLHDVLCVDFLLEKCQSIRKLAIDYHGLGFDPSCTFWMNKNFPHLRTIILQNLNEPNIDLTQFLQLNPQSKTVLSDDPSAIKSICLTKTFLPYAAMRFYFEEELLRQLNNIKQCCKNKFIKSLDLLLSSDDSNDVPDLQTLQSVIAVKHIGGLHFAVGRENIGIFEMIGSQPNIKRLCLRINTEMTENEAKKIAKCFPNISELRISLEHTITIRFNDIMLPFLSRISTLNVIYFRYFGGEIEYSNDDMVQMDSIRRKLEFVAKVKVYFCTKNFIKFIRPTGSSLTFEAVAHFDCSFCNSYWIDLDFINSLDNMQ